LKKKSEDLFRACQKYYELEQDIAFIKIDAKFDLLSNNIGSLEEPDNVSEHSVFLVVISNIIEYFLANIKYR